MNSFLNGSQINELQSIFSSHFQQFSTGINNQILIIKEPVKIVNNPSEQVLAGYGGENMDITSVTYQPVTGVFPAMIIYPNQLKGSQFGQLKFELDDDQVMVKVQQNARDFILNGKTERIIVNNLDYNMELTPKVQNFFGSLYYYFECTVTK